jgi:two-component system, NarL family, response regulator NreC
MKSVKIAIADDHPVVRSALKIAIGKRRGWSLSGEAGTGFELLDLIKSVNPEVAIIDLKMPGMEGYDTIAEISALYPELKIIVFSGFLNATDQRQIIKSGVSATVSKSDSIEDLFKAIEAVIRDESYYLTEFTCVDEKPLENEADDFLTLREKQILRLIAQGKNSKKISDICHISKWTVDKHRSNIRAKLGMKNVAEMVRYAIDSGYVD